MKPKAHNLSLLNRVGAFDFLFLLGSFYAWIVMCLLSNIYFSILVFSILCLVVIFRSKKFGVLDPRFITTPFFYMYHTWFSFKILNDPNGYLIAVDVNGLALSLEYSVLAYIVMINFFNIFLRSNKDGSLSPPIKVPLHGVSFLFWILLSITALSVLSFVGSGASSKRELIEGGGGLHLFSYYCVIFLTVIVLLRVQSLEYEAIFSDKRVLIFILAVIAYFGATGERDVLFRAILCLLLIYYDKKGNFGIAHLFILAGLAAFIVPLSQYFKAFFLSGGASVTLSELDIFGNEFMSASRNLYYLIDYGVDHDISFLFNDVVRAFIPTFLVDSSYISTVKWFHLVYRVDNGFDGTSGWGFGLVAQGYLIGGYLGVVLIFSLCSAILCFIYNRRYSSSFYNVFYLMAITVFMYIFRADFAGFLSQIFKIFGLSVLSIYFFNLILKKLSSVKKVAEI